MASPPLMSGYGSANHNGGRHPRASSTNQSLDGSKISNKPRVAANHNAALTRMSHCSSEVNKSSANLASAVKHITEANITQNVPIYNDGTRYEDSAYNSKASTRGDMDTGEVLFDANDENSVVGYLSKFDRNSDELKNDFGVLKGKTDKYTSSVPIIHGDNTLDDFQNDFCNPQSLDIVLIPPTQFSTELSDFADLIGQNDKCTGLKRKVENINSHEKSKALSEKTSQIQKLFQSTQLSTQPDNPVCPELIKTYITIENENMVLGDKNVELQEEIYTLKNYFTEWSNEKKILNDKISKLQSLCDEYSEENINLKEATAEWEICLNKMNKENEIELKPYVQRLQQMETNENELKNQSEEMKNKLKENGQHMQEVKNINEMITKFLATQIKNNTEDLENSLAENRNLENKLQEKDIEMQKLNMKMSEKISKTQRYIKHLGREYQQELDNLHCRIDDMDNELCNLNQDCSYLENKLQEEEYNYKTLEEKLKSEGKNFTENFEMITAQLKMAEQTNKFKEVTYSEIRNELNKYKNENDNLKKLRNQLQTSSPPGLSDIHKCQGSMKEVPKEMTDECKAAIDNLKRKYEKAMKDHARKENEWQMQGQNLYDENEDNKIRIKELLSVLMKLRQQQTNSAPELCKVSGNDKDKKRIDSLIFELKKKAQETERYKNSVAGHVKDKDGLKAQCKDLEYENKTYVDDINEKISQIAKLKKESKYFEDWAETVEEDLENLYKYVNTMGQKFDVLVLPKDELLNMLLIAEKIPTNRTPELSEKAEDAETDNYWNLPLDLEIPHIEINNTKYILGLPHKEEICKRNTNPFK